MSFIRVAWTWVRAYLQECGTLTVASALKKISLPLSFIAYKFGGGVSTSPFLGKLLTCPVFTVFPLSSISSQTLALVPLLGCSEACWTWHGNADALLYYFILPASVQFGEHMVAFYFRGSPVRTLCNGCTSLYSRQDTVRCSHSPFPYEHAWQAIKTFLAGGGFHLHFLNHRGCWTFIDLLIICASFEKCLLRSPACFQLGCYYYYCYSWYLGIVVLKFIYVLDNNVFFKYTLGKYFLLCLFTFLNVFFA